MGLIRQSRYSTAPTITEDGEVVEVRLTRHDLDLFRVMAPYPFITTDFLAEITGRHRVGINTRLRQLKRQPGMHVIVADPYRNINGKTWYALPEKTRELVKGYGWPVHTNEFAGSSPNHTLYCVQLRSSFDIAARQIPELSVLAWHDLKNDPRVPAGTRTSEKPHYLKIPQHVQIKGHAATLIPDCYPFIVKSGDASYAFVIEADMGTETIAGKIAAKIAYYRYVLSSGLHREQFGFPKLYVAFVTAREGRVQNILDEIAKQTRNDEKLRHYFLVKYSPAPGDLINQVEATGHMVTEPWHRASQAPLYIHKV